MPAGSLLATRGVARAFVPVEGPLDLGATLGPLAHGRHDPTVVFVGAEVWRATRTPEGHASLRLRPVPGGVEATAWGPGCDWALARAPDLVGAHDDVDAFAPVARAHPLVAELHRRRPGVRIPRTGAVFEAMAPAIIEQKVTAVEARRSWMAIIRRWGSPAPGPAGEQGMRIAPDPDRLARLPYHAFHRYGIERRRAATLLRAARHARRLDETASLPLPEAYRRMQAIDGVGGWTAAEVAVVALGDADAVSVGDYHLKNQVAYALAGEPRADDERMLELLEPFRGHRARVCRLLAASGRTAPRYGPRLATQVSFWPD